MAESSRLEEEEKRRVEERKARLGEEGLKMWKDKVDKAKETNEVSGGNDDDDFFFYIYT